MSNPAPRDCTHGQLARSCDICELQGILATSQATLSALSAILSLENLDTMIEQEIAVTGAWDMEGENARYGAEKLRDALAAKVTEIIGASNHPDQLADYEDVLERVRQVVRLTRATPGVPTSTLCDQIDRLIGKASPEPTGPVLYGAMWPPNTASVMKIIEDIASSLDLGTQDRYYSLVQAFARGKNHEIRTTLLGPLLEG